MKKYFPSQTEAAMFFAGLFVGTMLMAWFSPWESMVAIAPVFLIVEMIIYVYNKRKQDYARRLAEAKDADVLLGNKRGVNE